MTIGSSCYISGGVKSGGNVGDKINIKIYENHLIRGINKMMDMDEKVIEILMEYINDSNSRIRIINQIKSTNWLQPLSVNDIRFIKYKMRGLYAPNQFYINYVLSEILTMTMSFDRMYNLMMLFQVA